MNGPESRPLLTVSQAAQLLGVSKNRAYKWAHAGVLPGLRQPTPDSQMFVIATELEAALAGGDWPSGD